VPCARLSWPSRQLLSAVNIAYRIVLKVIYNAVTSLSFVEYFDSIELSIAEMLT